MGITFIQTGDLHIGKPYKGLKGISDKLKKSRMDVLGYIAAYAASCDIDFILITGDNLDDPHISSITIARFINLLNEMPCPVYLITGNHDPADKQSPYHKSIFQDKIGPHVHLILAGKSIIDIETPNGEKVKLFATPCIEKFQSEDPTEWFPIRDDNNPPRNTYHLGMIHGTLKGQTPDDEENQTFPFNENSAIKHDLDYLAVGHFHNHSIHIDTHPEKRFAYAGSPEPTGWGYSRSGKILQVDIAKPGCVPEIQGIVVSKNNWIEKKINIDNHLDFKEIKRTYNEWKGTASELNLLKLVITGKPSDDTYIEVTDWIDTIEADFNFLKRKLDKFNPKLDSSNLTSGAMSELAKETYKLLKELSDTKNPSALLMRGSGNTLDKDLDASRALENCERIQNLRKLNEFTKFLGYGKLSELAESAIGKIYEFDKK